MVQGRGLAGKFLGVLWLCKTPVISTTVVEKSLQQPGPIDAKEQKDTLYTC